MLAASRKLHRALASLGILMKHGKFKSWMLEVVMLAAGQLTNSLVSGLTIDSLPWKCVGSFVPTHSDWITLILLCKANR